MNTQAKTIEGYSFVKYQQETFAEAEMLARSQQFYAWLNERRSVRDFSSKPIAKKIIDTILLTASTAPSGAHKQPWTFCVVSDPEIKKQIRIEAEKEERESYNGRMSEEWLEDVRPLQTDWQKPF